MLFLLLTWLLPFIIALLCIYLIEDESATVRDALQIVGISLIPLVNWVLIYIVVTEIVKNHEKIQEFLDRKLK